MPLIKRNKIKAGFFLTVFALNTVLAFACSIGVNMGYNTKHHHKNDKEHDVAQSHNHTAVASSHHHNKAENSPNGHNTSGKDDCCNKSAVQLQLADKSFSQAAKININTPVTLLAFNYFDINSLLYFSDKAFNKQYYFVRSNHPPIPDIRVAIQSFQI